MKTVARIRDLMNTGDMQHVLDEISAINTDQLSKKEIDELSYYKSVAYLNSNQVDRATQIINTITIENTCDASARNIARFDYLRGTIAFLNGNFDDTVSHLNRGLQLLDDVDQDDVDTMNLLGDLYNRVATAYTSKGDYETSIKYSLKSLDQRQKLDQKEKIGATLYNLGTTYFQSGNLDKAIEYLDRTAEIFASHENMLGIAYCKMELGGVYQYQGQLDTALDNFIEAHELYKQYGSQTQVAWSLTDLGNIYQHIGEVDRSLDYYNEALPLYESINDPRVYGNHMRAMAISYRMKGQYEKAKQFNLGALELYRSIDNENYMARAYFQLAEDNMAQEDYTQALKYLSESRILFEKISNIDYLGRVYYLHLAILIDQEKMDTVDTIMTSFDHILDQSTSDLLDQMYRLSHAIIMTKSDRLLALSTGQQALKEIIQAPVREIQVTTRAYLALLEILIREFQITKSHDVIDEITQYADDLLQLAEKQSSPSLRIKVMLIQSKLAILTFDLDRAANLLEIALDVSSSKGFSSLSSTIIALQDELKEQSGELNELFLSNRDIDEVLQFTGLKQFIGNLISNRYGNLTKRMDIPVHINIISSFGLSIYSKNFADIEFEDQLLAAFVTAISQFSAETFKEKQILDLIRLDDYQLSFKRLESFSVCYLYKGSTIAARYKLDNFTYQITDQYYSLIEDAIQHSYRLEEDDIGEIVDQLILF